MCLACEMDAWWFDDVEAAAAGADGAPEADRPETVAAPTPAGQPPAAGFVCEEILPE